MNEVDTLLLVGCGNMGFALLQAWTFFGVVRPSGIHVIEPNDQLRERAMAAGVHTYRQLGDIGDMTPDVVVLAVKPQILKDEAAGFAHFAGKATFVSIAAGVTLDTLSEALGKARIVRAMPNTPAAVGKGMTVVCANSFAGPRGLALATRLLSGTGKVLSAENEDMMNAVTAISGSGPAYVFYFMECLRQAGIELGLPAEFAHVLALETINGASAMALTSEDAPETLRQNVTSPNGTTAAALDVLMSSGGMEPLVMSACRAAYDRAVELSR